MAMGRKNNTNIFEQWKKWLDDPQDDGRVRAGLWQTVADMQIDQKVFNDLQGVVNDYLKQIDADDDAGAELVEWMTRNYVANACLAVRRFAESNKQGSSMRQLLDDLVTHHEVLTRGNLLEHGCRSDATIDTLSKGIGLDPFPISVIKDDIQALENTVKSIKTFADKVLAHSDRNAHKFPIPTYDELATAIEFCRDIYEKYALLLAGSSCQLQGPKSSFVDLPDCRTYFARIWVSPRGPAR
jgi:hypothetical protein